MRSANSQEIEYYKKHSCGKPFFGLRSISVPDELREFEDDIRNSGLLNCSMFHLGFRYKKYIKDKQKHPHYFTKGLFAYLMRERQKVGNTIVLLYNPNENQEKEEEHNETISKEEKIQENDFVHKKEKLNDETDIKNVIKNNISSDQNNKNENVSNHENGHIMMKTVSIDSFQSIDTFPKQKRVARIYGHRSTPKNEYLLTFDNDSHHSNSSSTVKLAKWYLDSEAFQFNGFNMLHRSFQNNYENSIVQTYGLIKNNKIGNQDSLQYLFSSTRNNDFIFFIDSCNDQYEIEAVESFNNFPNGDLFDVLRYSFINLNSLMNINENSISNHNVAQNSNICNVLESNRKILDLMKFDIVIEFDIIHEILNSGLNNLDEISNKMNLSLSDLHLIVGSLIFACFQILPYEKVFNYPMTILKLFEFFNDFSLTFIKQPENNKNFKLKILTNFILLYKHHVKYLSNELLLTIEGKESYKCWKSYSGLDITEFPTKISNNFQNLEFLLEFPPNFDVTNDINQTFIEFFAGNSRIPYQSQKIIRKYIKHFHTVILANQSNYHIVFDRLFESDCRKVIKIFLSFGLGCSIPQIKALSRSFFISDKLFEKFVSIIRNRILSFKIPTFDYIKNIFGYSQIFYPFENSNNKPNKKFDDESNNVLTNTINEKILKIFEVESLLQTVQATMKKYDETDDEQEGNDLFLKYANLFQKFGISAFSDSCKNEAYKFLPNYMSNFKLLKEMLATKSFKRFPESTISQ
ncbi:hypothetical protein TRFO_12112 [Tritrichomonas foetus]|uniref:Uncharacterized protein n=1 Tax=Tritrichomonas foetus TaxID=1144522 RepID=A0A1J4J099_9EUKA|nr:hypothetical protein TRFO_12112 [Tritrichomonas foetus]|eukprot:OHS93086.1 hypothetical protein TRFO_12112 [Tritrichomonas foetus]